MISDIFERIRQAHIAVRVCACRQTKVWLLAQDYAICMAPTDYAADQLEKEKDRQLHDTERRDGK